MKRLLLLLIMCMLSSGQALAQKETIPDTLDWRLYFPLQFGNVWEYFHDNFPRTDQASYGRSEIVGDTTIGGTVYFVVQGQGFDKDLAPTGQGRTYLRYDSTARAVVRLNIGGCCPGEYSYQGACDLGAPFPKDDNSIDYSCPNGEGTLHLSGSYTDKYLRIGNDSIHVAAEKHFNFGGPGITFNYGVGVPGGVSEGGYSTTSLTYLRVDGKEYGTSIAGTSMEDVEPVTHKPPAIVSIYPNPFHERIFVQYSTPQSKVTRVEVFNVLGQRVWRDEMFSTGSNLETGEITAGDWTAGIYLLRLLSDNGGIQTRKIIKVD